MILKGCGAVVTGGGQGIGAAVARALARAGATVIVAARSVDRVAAVAAEIQRSGGDAFAVSCDVTNPESVRALAGTAGARVPTVDILVNNAGSAHSAPLHRVTLEDWNRVLAVNATGTFLVTQAFLPAMLERRRGAIVNVASVAGLAGARYIAAYAAAKHAVIGFTRSIAAEVAGTGVTCNAVCPGYVDTAMTRESVARVVAKTGTTPAEALQAMLAASAQRRLITPEEVAHVVVDLCAQDTRNGEAIPIHGV
ncbi:MAG: SDR family NAD(P)-dependent oxidoreductase [Gemmatimonadales bacterium]|nr:SDR family NAD(P)-dependent oxidoreductase [Gemmatimonadales bacterium]